TLAWLFTEWKLARRSRKPWIARRGRAATKALALAEAAGLPGNGQWVLVRSTWECGASPRRFQHVPLHPFRRIIESHPQRGFRIRKRGLPQRVLKALRGRSALQSFAKRDRAPARTGNLRSLRGFSPIVVQRLQIIRNV